MRLDQYLVLHHYFESRNKAAAAVKEGTFAVNGKKITKPSYVIVDGAEVTCLNNKRTYVARSAQKLLNAYQRFRLDWQGRVAADLGASTGGFCQVLLENDIKKIYAVDIGTAQLHPEVKKDVRVVNMEHTNARYINKETFPEAIEVITADLSFISVKAVIPAIYQTLVPAGQAVILVKPQFEAGPQHLSKSGVVNDRKIQYKVLEEIALYAEECGFSVNGIAFSGLPGESGNREYLLWIEKDSKSAISVPSAAHAAVYAEEEHE